MMRLVVVLVQLMWLTVGCQRPSLIQEGHWRKISWVAEYVFKREKDSKNPIICEAWQMYLVHMYLFILKEDVICSYTYIV